MDPKFFCREFPVARSRRVQPLGLFIQLPDCPEMAKAKKAKAAPIVEGAKPALQITDRRAVHADPPKPSPSEGGTPKTPFSEPLKIIGEQKGAKPAPSLVGPKGESLAKPTAPTTDVRSSAQPKLFGSSGQQVHADSSKPSPFEGGLPETPSSGPSKIIQPGAKPTSGVISSSKPSSSSSGSLVDPFGEPMSSRLTEGPGAARPKPTIHMPGSEKPAGGKIETVSSGSTPKSTMTADELQWNAAISSAKQREGKVAQNEAESRPLDFKPGTTQKPASSQKPLVSRPETAPMSSQQNKMMAAADGGSKKGEGKPSAGGTQEGARKPGRGPNVLGSFGTGYQIGIQGDPAATVSLVGHRAAGAAHGLLSPSTDHEQGRMQREAYQQRAEMLRQSSQQSQSSMQRSLSISARPDTPPVRSGLRRP